MLVPVNIADGQVSGVDSLSASCSQLINWEVDEAGINAPRPPLVTQSIPNIGTSPIIGACKWSNYTIIVCANRYIGAINDQVPDYVHWVSSSSTSTQLEGAASRPTFATGDESVYIAGGGRIQRWNPSLSMSEVLSDSPDCTHVVSIANYLVTNSIEYPSRIYWSDLGEGAWGTWPAANFTTADARPDPVLAVYENANNLFVWGSETLQVYGLGADPALPFEVVGTTNRGIGAPYACCAMDEGFAYLDAYRQVVTGGTGEPAPISDAIKGDLRGLSTVSDCWLYREERGQRSSIVVRFPTEGRTFVYDLTGQRWSERKYYSAPFLADWPVSAAVYVPRSNTWLFGSTDEGMYAFDDGPGLELGAPLVCERTTGWVDFGSKKRKRSRCVQLTMRRGTAAQGATPGALEVRVQNDDGPWSAWQQVTIGAPSDYNQIKRLFLGGVFYRRRYGFRFSNSEQTALVDVADDITELST